MTAAPCFVLVSGPPGSGKSTLAPALAEGLALPLISKDAIKDALMAVLPVPDVLASKQIGRAAVAAMYAVATQATAGAVLECNFDRSAAAEEVRRLPGTVVEVFCRCPLDEAARRYAARAGSRDRGHFDDMRQQAGLWDGAASEPVAGGWPVLEVDTTVPIDVAAVIGFVRSVL